MRILLLGSGGREHAFGWKISESTMLEKMFFAPGNAGTKNLGENVNIAVDDFKAIKKFVLENKINMVFGNCHYHIILLQHFSGQLSLFVFYFVYPKLLQCFQRFWMNRLSLRNNSGRANLPIFDAIVGKILF